MRFLAVALVMSAGLATAAYAADRPSQQVLSDMGLGGMTVLSDSQAQSVRGFGYSPTRAAGWGFAVVATKGASAGSMNSYSAQGKHKSWGENASEAGVEISTSGGHGGGYGSSGGYGGGSTKSIVAFSGGSSRAGRK